MINFEKLMKQPYHIHALHLRSATENILCSHLLSPSFYRYIYNDHNYIDGFPKLIHTNSKVLDQCTTCIQSKMSKTPPGNGTNCAYIHPYQGL